MTKLLEYLEVALHITTIICLVAIAISLILFIYRVITGPSNPDRAMALDVIGVCLMAIAALTSILVITTKLTDVILLIGILSFIRTLALASYIETGVLIERDDDCCDFTNCYVIIHCKMRIGNIYRNGCFN